MMIGEISAWLILALARGLFSQETYSRYSKLMLFGLPLLSPAAFAVCLFIASLISKRTAIVYQITKFIFVGELNTLVDWGALILITSISLSSFGVSSERLLIVTSSFIIYYYTIFKAISFVISAVNSYAWNKSWTFDKKKGGKRRKEFLQFFVISLVGLLINVAVASIIFRYFSNAVLFTESQRSILSAGLATVISMAWNFIGYRFIVFNSQRPLESEEVVSESGQPIQEKVNALTCQK